MRTKRAHFLILWITAFVYLLTFFDTFFSRAKIGTEVCTELLTKSRSFRRTQKTYYYLNTTKHTYTINEQLYYATSIGEDVLVGRSALTGAYKFIEVTKKGEVIKCNIQFITEPWLVVLIFFTSVTIAFMIFYDKVRYSPGRMNLTIFLAAIAIGLFILHMRGLFEL